MGKMPMEPTGWKPVLPVLETPFGGMSSKGKL